MGAAGSDLATPGLGRKIVLAGAGTHCCVLIELLQDLGWEPVAVFDPNVTGEVLGLPICGEDQNAREYFSKGVRYAQIASVSVCKLHSRLVTLYESMGFQIPTLVSPFAHISRTARLGRGSVILHGADVGTEAVVGAYATINVHGVISHGAHLGECSEVAPNATVLGRTQIGNRTLVGAGSTVLQELTVGEDCVVGAGSVVIRSVPSGSKVAGVPARVL